VPLLPFFLFPLPLACCSFPPSVLRREVVAASWLGVLTANRSQTLKRGIIGYGSALYHLRLLPCVCCFNKNSASCVASFGLLTLSCVASFIVIVLVWSLGSLSRSLSYTPACKIPIYPFVHIGLGKALLSLSVLTAFIDLLLWGL